MTVSKQQLGHMLDRLSPAGTSRGATVADAAALVAVSEGFAAAFCGREVELEDLQRRARKLVEEQGPALVADAGELEQLANAAEALLHFAVGAARRVWP